MGKTGNENKTEVGNTDPFSELLQGHINIEGKKGHFFDQEMIAELREFVSKVWFMRHAQKTFEGGTLQEKYEQEVDEYLSVLVDKEVSNG